MDEIIELTQRVRVLIVENSLVRRSNTNLRLTNAGLLSALSLSIEVAEEAIAQESAGGQNSYFDLKNGWSAKITKCRIARERYQNIF